MVFTISFLSKYGELWGIFPKTIYVFTKFTNPFYFGHQKEKKTLTWRGKKDLVQFIERLEKCTQSCQI